MAASFFFFVSSSFSISLAVSSSAFPDQLSGFFLSLHCLCGLLANAFGLLFLGFLIFRWSRGSLLDAFSLDSGGWSSFFVSFGSEDDASFGSEAGASFDPSTDGSVGFSATDFDASVADSPSTFW